MRLKKEQKERINLSRRFLEPGYIQKKVEGGFIRTPNFHIILEDIIKVLEESYPGLWDIQFSWDIDRINGILGLKTNQMYIIIKFPEVTISNSRKLQTLIKDLYVRIPVELKSDSIYFNTIDGTRSTLTNAEKEGNYLHSHLPLSTSPCEFSTFCTGSGEINNITALLNADFDVDLFKLYLFNLETFTSWESLEGTPYRYISELLESSDLILPITSRLRDYHSDIIKYLKENTSEISNIQWKINKGKYEITETPKLEKLLSSFYIASRNSIHQIKCLKNNKGEYIKQRELVNKSLISETLYLVFRGDKDYFEIIDDFEPLNDPELYINPSIKNYFKKQLEYAANSKAITASIN